MPANSYYTPGLSTNGTAVPAKHISSAAPQSGVKQTAIFDIGTYDALVIESTVIAKSKRLKRSRLPLLYKSTAYFPHLSTLAKISCTPRWKWLLCFGRLWSAEHFVEAIKGPFPLPESVFKTFQMSFFFLFLDVFYVYCQKMSCWY